MLKQLITLLLFLPSIIFAAAPIAGKDYQLINNPQPIKSTAILVQEFFSYGCPWCYKIDAPLQQWINKNNSKINFERVPVVFKPSWELYAKAYYAAKILALNNKLSPLLFKTIQTDKKLLDTPQQMVQFFAAHGIDKEIAKSAFQNSPSIEMHVQQGMILMSTYQINAVPAFVINNKYKTDLQMAGSPERLFEILDSLVKKA